MSKLKKILKAIGLFFVVLIVLSGAYMSTNWPFWSNVLTLTANFSSSMTDESLYEPKAIIAGDFKGPIPVAEISKLSTATIKTLDDYVAANTSAALIVYQGGAIHYERYGDGFDARLRTESASMAKSVLAMMVGAAIDDGYITSVDDPIGKYYRDWAGTPKGDVPIKHYLQMSAGLRLHPMFGPPSSPMFQVYMGDDIRSNMKNVDIEFEPGEEFQYTGLQSQALLLAAEEASGKPYAEYVSEKLWQPLGAGDAAVWLDRVGGSPRGFCCMYATARDWLRVGRMHLNLGNVDGKQLISAAWMRDVITPSPKNPNYGYQTWLGTEHVAERGYSRDVSVKVTHAEAFAVDDLIYFDGAGGQRVYISPSEDMVIVHTGPMNFDFEESWLPNLIVGDL